MIFLFISYEYEFYNLWLYALQAIFFYFMACIFFLEYITESDVQVYVIHVECNGIEVTVEYIVHSPLQVTVQAEVTVYFPGASKL